MEDLIGWHRQWNGWDLSMRGQGRCVRSI
jgi:hypothetical protein